jgi:hypothetical protein
LRRREDTSTGFRSHGVWNHRCESCGASSRGARGPATGLRGHAAAVYLRICAGRSRKVTAYLREYGDRLRGDAAHPRKYEDGPRRSRPTCWTTEIGRAVQLIATLGGRALSRGGPAGWGRLFGGTPPRSAPAFSLAEAPAAGGWTQRTASDLRRRTCGALGVPSGRPRRSAPGASGGPDCLLLRGSG